MRPSRDKAQLPSEQCPHSFRYPYTDTYLCCCLKKDHLDDHEADFVNGPYWKTGDKGDNLEMGPLLKYHKNPVSYVHLSRDKTVTENQPYIAPEDPKKTNNARDKADLLWKLCFVSGILAIMFLVIRLVPLAEIALLSTVVCGFFAIITTFFKRTSS